MLALDHTRLAQHFRRDRSLAQRRQLLQVHDVEFLAENVGKSALGHAAMQGHLAAFKAAHHARAAARTLAFVSADGRIIRALDHLVQPGKAQTLNHQLLLDRGTNGGTYPFQMDFGAATWTRFLCQFMRHDYSSSTDLPRMAATSLRFFKCLSASNVALITLCGLVVPIDLVNTF